MASTAGCPGCVMTCSPAAWYFPTEVSGMPKPMSNKTGSLLAALALLIVTAPARAQGADPATAAEIARLKSDVARLEQELQQQKQLLIQLMQGEQQRYDMLMQLIRSGQAPRAGEL